MKKLLLLPLLAVFAVSCSSSRTPAKRIEKNAEAYNKLSARHQELVENGRIEEGMSREAVLLAWGEPGTKTEGQLKGRSFEKWSYTGLAPVYRQSFGGGFGYGHGFRRFGHGRFGRRGFGHRGGFGSFGSFGTSVSYVPFRTAWVKFEGGRVESWQRGKSR